MSSIRNTEEREKKKKEAKIHGETGFEVYLEPNDVAQFIAFHSCREEYPDDPELRQICEDSADEDYTKAEERRVKKEREEEEKELRQIRGEEEKEE